MEWKLIQISDFIEENFSMIVEQRVNIGSHSKEWLYDSIGLNNMNQYILYILSNVFPWHKICPVSNPSFYLWHHAGINECGWHVMWIFFQFKATTLKLFLSWRR